MFSVRSQSPFPTDFQAVIVLAAQLLPPFQSVHSASCDVDFFALGRRRPGGSATVQPRAAYPG
jgi:hypothetical protein